MKRRVIVRMTCIAEVIIEEDIGGCQTIEEVEDVRDIEDFEVVDD